MRALYFIIIFIAFVVGFASGQNDDLRITRVQDVPIDAKVNQLKIDANNTLYACTTNGLIVITNGQVEKTLPGVNVVDVAFDIKSGAYAIDATKVYHLGDASATPSKETDVVFASCDFYDEKLYIASDKGIFIFKPSTKSFDQKTVTNSELPSNKVNFVYTDTKNRCWIGTSKGEVRIEAEKWQMDHKDRNITHCYENKEGIWFISINEKKKQEMWLIDHFNRFYDAGFGPDLYKGAFNDFAIDGKGMLYFASDAFIKFDPYDDKTKNFTENASAISQKCSTTLCDQMGDIWIGTDGNGLFKLSFKDTGILSVSCIIEKKVSCDNKNDGVLRVIATGGIQPLSYRWSESNMVGNNPKNLSPGDYVVTVADASGNSQICTINLPRPELLFVDLVTMDPIKSYNGKEGKIEVRGIGGAGEYLYIWQNGSKKSHIEKLAAGTYKVTVTDKNKCSAVGEYNLSREKILPELTSATIEVGKTLRINELNFKADSSVIDPKSIDVLDELYAFLSSNPNVVVEIGGHTNTIPPHEYCDKLSTDRARSVAEYFYKKGIPIARLSYKGYGKRQPLTNDGSLAGRQKNQRVEIKIVAI